MISLKINEFSCVRLAELELSDLTVLIGPQASGKSVISKLSYFFFQLLDELFTVEEDSKSFSDFQKHSAEKFKHWFPPSAWGRKKFQISFVLGKAEVNVQRTAFNTKPSQNVKIGALNHPGFAGGIFV
jgi:predicted ATPase